MSFNKTQEALKMAIEALEWANEVSHSLDRYDWVIQACKEALAQPAQEPVAWISVKDKLPDVGVEVLTYDTRHEKKYFLNSIIIYNVDKFYFNGFTHWMPLPSAPNEINTHPAPEQNEFARTKSCQECENLKHDLEGYMDANKALINREWQGLSDDDVHNYADHNFAFASEHFEEIFNFYRAIEQALKEKNT